MGDNWDDDDFEVEDVAPPPVEEKVEDFVPGFIPVEKGHAAKPKPKWKAGNEKSAFNMEDLGRELTFKEREELQKRSDMAFARDLFGGEDEEVGYDRILSKDEFEQWGDKVGRFLATRHQAAHYGDMLNKVMVQLAAPLDAADIRKMSNLLKQMADEKKVEAEKTKKAAPGAKGKKGKPTIKSSGGKAGDMFDDYGGSGGRHDEYDDFM